MGAFLDLSSTSEFSSRLRHTARRQAGLVSIGQLARDGMSRGVVRSRLAQGVWVRVVRGVVDPSPRPEREIPLPQLRRRAAWTALLATEPEGIAVGACALALHGVWGLPRLLTPEVALPGGRFTRGVDGVLVRQYRTPMTTVPHHNRRIAHPITALAQALPGFTVQRAVAVLDSAVYRRVIDPPDVDEVRAALYRRRDSRHLLPCWSLVDGRAESPNETFARLDCTAAGIPPDDLQVVLRLPDGHKARGDLGWRRPDGTWVLAELDSKEFHDTPEALFRDRTRQNAIALLGGYTQLRFLERDIYDGTLVRDVTRALHRP